MKNKYVIFALLCAAVIGSFAGCAKANGDGVGGVADSTERIYEEHNVDERDENGNLILKSTEYRRVYNTEPGTYLAVVFGDSGVSNITIIKDFGTSDAALAYMLDGANTLRESGEYTNFNLDGKYVIYSPTLDNEKYGIYYKMNKSAAEAELSKYAQN